MPALDLDTIGRLGSELHTTSNGVINEGEVCPWTLFLTMALALLKGVLPHVPRMLPVLISDPEVRERAAETFQSQEFKDNIEEYFVQNIKTDVQAPLNRQIIKSSETVMYAVDLMNNLVATFLGPNKDIEGNDIGTTDNKPRSMFGGSAVGKLIEFASQLYRLT